MGLTVYDLSHTVCLITGVAVAPMGRRTQEMVKAGLLSNNGRTSRHAARATTRDGVRLLLAAMIQDVPAHCAASVRLAESLTNNGLRLGDDLCEVVDTCRTAGGQKMIVAQVEAFTISSDARSATVATLSEGQQFYIAAKDDKPPPSIFAVPLQIQAGLSGMIFAHIAEHTVRGE